VVFGVGAEEAERLSDLLERDEGADPRYNQGLLWEPEGAGQLPRTQEHGVNGVHPHEAAAQDAGHPGAAEPAPGEWAPGHPALQQAASGAERAGSPESGDPASLSADLAGWTSGELPGQASAGLSAWPQSRPAPAGTDRTARPAPAGPDQSAQQAPGSAPGAAESAAWLRLA
jgi:hypothetical protein